MSVRFTLEKRTNKFGECPIRLSWSFGGQRYQTTLGFSIKNTNWDGMKRLVKAGTHNYKGQTADDINFYIKRISLVVTSIEQHFTRNEKVLTKDRMKQAINDACGLNIARPKDIVERCSADLVEVSSKPKSLYYYDNYSDKYYQYICDAKHIYPAGGKYKILQELFGKGERIVVPLSEFELKRKEGEMYPSTHFEIVSYEKVFGR